MKLENRIFNGRQIRMVWSESEGKWYFSVVDVIEALTETERPRKYWSDLKSVLKSDDFELSEKVGKIGQLKLKSTDGKSYKTDVAGLYGVDTKRVNEAVKNNPDKFPEDYMFALTPDENNHLRSKFSTANISPKSPIS